MGWLISFFRGLYDSTTTVPISQGRKWRLGNSRSFYLSVTMWSGGSCAVLYKYRQTNRLQNTSCKELQTGPIPVVGRSLFRSVFWRLGSAIEQCKHLHGLVGSCCCLYPWQKTKNAWMCVEEKTELMWKLAWSYKEIIRTFRPSYLLLGTFSIATLGR